MSNQNSISLHELVDAVVMDIQPLAQGRMSLITNEVQPGISVQLDKFQFMTFFRNILYFAIANSQNDSIRIVARSYNYVTSLHIRNNDSRCEDVIVRSLNKFKNLADQLKGCLSVTKNNSYGASISFTFLNM
jgi:hypothetical protein